MEEKFEEIGRNIRACLNSSKRQSSLQELSRDYKAVLGEAIPYFSLGFSSLEALVRKVPQLKVTKCGNDVFVDVKPDEKTMHIATLVREQKDSKKKPKKRVSGRSVYRPPPPPRRTYELSTNQRKPSPKTSFDSYPIKKDNGGNREYERSRNYENSRDHEKSRNYENSRDHEKSRNYEHSKNNEKPREYERSQVYDNAREYENYRRQDSPILISSEEESSESKRQDSFSSPKSNEFENSDSEDDLVVTLGTKFRQVSVGSNKNAVKRGRFVSTTSNDDDKGYSSMSGRNSKPYSCKNDNNFEDENSYRDFYSYVSDVPSKTNQTVVEKQSSKSNANFGPKIDSNYICKNNFVTLSGNEKRNISGTVSNGSDRKRVVEFLLR